MTLAEVAKRAGVSTATVSRVLNNATTVRGATRERVLEAVRELKYEPNLHAKALAGGKSRSLGLIVSNLRNPYFLDVYGSLEAVAVSRGYEVLVESTDYRPERLRAAAHSMLRRHLAGIAVIVSESDDEGIALLAGCDVPIVFHDVGRGAAGAGVRIVIDWAAPMRRMVDYLYTLGHRRLAFVGHHVGLGSLQTRRQTFLEALERGSRDVEFAAETDVDSPEGGRRAARRLLDTDFRPTAVLCVNDYMALGVLREIHDRGLSVPRDISVAGFDNINLSEFTHPPLTTVDVPRERIGRKIFDALVRGERGGGEIMIRPELVIRDSVARARERP